MTLHRLLFIGWMILVASNLPAQNQLNSRLFYSKPPLYNSKSKLTRLNFSFYHITVMTPTDDRSKFYGEKIYKNVTAHALDEFFESPVVVEIQNKMIADLKRFSQ